MTANEALDTDEDMQDPVSPLASVTQPYTHCNDSVLVNAESLPHYDIMMLHHFTNEDSWARKLWQIAERSAVR